MFSQTKPVVFYEAEGAAAGGAPPQSETPPSNTPTKTEVESIVQRTIQSVMDSKRVNGDTSAALEVLAAKAIKEEKRAQEAEAKIGKIPDDVQAKLTAFEALGTVEELTKRLENATSLETEKAQRELTDQFRKAATVAGYDADALLEVIGEVPQSIVETVKQGDKEIQSAKVKVLSEGKEVDKAFADFITGRFPKIHESLKVDAKQTVTLPQMGVGGTAVANTEEKARTAQQSLYAGNNF